jgi:very-short-patch-repair endonuclease
MGYADALRDGIRHYVDEKGTNCYVIPCVECGAGVKSWAYKSNIKYRCTSCREEYKEKEKSLKVNTHAELKNKRLNKALDRLRKQGNDLTKYEKAVEVIKSNFDKLDWFQSTEEIMVALELYKQNVKFNHQVKVDKYKIDFVIPEEKIILEIDGELFHNDVTKDRNRDNIILLYFGVDWEIVRINTAYINQNVKRIMQAIKAIKNNREKVRKSHNGQLPFNYSTQE